MPVARESLDALHLVQRIDLMVAMRRESARHMAALLAILVMGLAGLSAWGLARGRRISGIEESLSGIHNDISEIRGTCER